MCVIKNSFDVVDQGLVPGQVAETFVSTFAKEAIFKVASFVGTYGALYAIALTASKELEKLNPFGKGTIKVPA